MMLHTFTPGHIRTLHSTVREFADQYVDVLMKERERAEYNLLKYKKHLALDISTFNWAPLPSLVLTGPLQVGAASYGYRTGVLQKQDTPLAVALETIVSQVSNDTIRVPVPTALRAYFPSLDWWLLADTRLFHRNVKHLRKVAYEVLYTRKEALGVLTDEDRKHIKEAGLDIDRERVGNFSMGIDDVLSMMLQASLPQRPNEAHRPPLTAPQDAAMLDPDDPDKLPDEWILAQIMVLFWAGQ